MISARTKLLVCGCALTPAAVIIYGLQRRAIGRQFSHEGYALIAIDAGWWVQGMFLIGLVCFVSFVVSIIFGLSRTK